MLVSISNLPERLTYVVRSYSWLFDPRTFLPDSTTPIDRPIFLLGTQGGGLTLLSRMLRRHDDVVSAAGNSNYWTSADELQNVFGLVLPAELTGLRFKAPHHPILTAPRSWTFAARDLFGAYRKNAENASPKLARTLERIVRSNLRRHARKVDQARFIDKSQSYSVRAGLIWALLKEYDPVFVLVPRDPYVSVFRAANGKAADMKRLAEVLSYADRIDICAEHYANTMRAAMADAARHSFRFMIMRFEDLIADPVTSLRSVCEHCELSFDEDMLPARHHQLPFGSRFRDRWYPIKTDVNDVYEEMIDQITIERVNRHAAELLPDLGYTVRTP